MDQEKYILENVHPIHLANGRAGLDMEEPSHETDKFYWVSPQTRPDVSGAASILAQLLTKSTGSTVWRIPMSELDFER